MTVLVVDDQSAVRDALCEMVEALGYHCLAACNGEEAWRILQTEHVDVVLSDWQMPRMNGVELCQRIRNAENGNHYTYFILLTGLSDKEHFLRAMEAGADGCYEKCSNLNEIRAYLGSAERLVNLHRRLERESQTSLRAARTDPLTQLGNRLRLDEDLATVWSRTKRYRSTCAMAIVDVDEFKSYNDQFGHLAGDAVLQRIAQTIRRNVRDVDGVYRYGGEEFLVLLPEQALRQAVRAMNRVRKTIEQLSILNTSARRIVSVSIGVAELDPSVDASIDAWLARADAALYRAKALGRNRVEIAPSRPR
ncbi:diguanylate cyclase [Pendulispora brunnea]|uniref:diguanylate cyclase n=1 Tax=Pendulispora brunnea TaxID=2905690 RepID=A0ABZ2K2F0_9BACT